MALVMSMGIMAYAQDVPTGSTQAADKGQITVSNAAKGETYSIYKLFDATLTDVPATGTSEGIAYTGDIPESLKTYFTKDEAGNIHLTEAGGTAAAMSDGLKAALKSWAASADATASEVSDGSALNFNNLDFGYYVVTTTQGDQAITVDSTNPKVTIVDKNSSTPTAQKDVDDPDFSVGDTVTYTATFNAPNYLGDPTSEAGAKQIIDYKIKDTLPNFLTDVAITSVTVKEPTGTPGTTSDTVLSGEWAFNDDGEITVPWATQNATTGVWTSNYKAGSQIVVVYTATLTANAAVGAANENTVSLIPEVPGPDGPEPYQEEDEWHDSAEVTTHAAALQKKDDEGNNLAGAEFAFKGLTVIGEPGMYTVVSYDPDATENGTVMQCDEDGKLVIVGIDSAITLVGTETKAPDGYNKLDGTFNLATITMSKSTTTTWGSKVTYYDAEGNVVDEQTDGGSSKSETTYATVETIPADKVVTVENNKGVELPSTGGIGTTIFYVVGSILVVAAGVLRITKKRMSREG